MSHLTEGTEGECVKVKRMGAKTKGTGPSPASAGSCGAKISKFVLDMAMKNNTALDKLQQLS